VVVSRHNTTLQEETQKRTYCTVSKQGPFYKIKKNEMQELQKGPDIIFLKSEVSKV